MKTKNQNQKTFDLARIVHFAAIVSWYTVLIQTLRYREYLVKMHSSNNDEEEMLIKVNVDTDSLKLTCIQLSLKSIIYVLNHSMFWYFGIIWVLLVVSIAGAFVLTMLGGCTLSDCNTFGNMDSTILTVLFTLINLYALPVRVARLYTLIYHGSAVGVDVYGEIVPNLQRPKELLAESYDPSTFYHFSWMKKCVLVFLLMMSAIAQFVNQVSLSPSTYFFISL